MLLNPPKVEKQMQVEATGKFKDKETDEVTESTITLDYDFGDTLEAMLSEFGEEAVFLHARADMKVSVQGAIRGFIKAGLDEDQVLEKMTEWEMPSGAPRSKDPVDKLEKILGKLSAEEREAVLAKVMAAQEDAD